MENNRLTVRERLVIHLVLFLIQMISINCPSIYNFEMDNLKEQIKEELKK